MLVRRIPWFHEKVVDAGLIDGANRGVCVRVRSEQCPLRTGKDVHGLLQKFHTVHARHALIGK